MKYEPLIEMSHFEYAAFPVGITLTVVGSIAFSFFLWSWDDSESKRSKKLGVMVMVLSIIVALTGMIGISIGSSANANTKEQNEEIIKENLAQKYVDEPGFAKILYDGKKNNGMYTAILNEGGIAVKAQVSIADDGEPFILLEDGVTREFIDSLQKDDVVTQ